jgi:predicted dehydrogenase
VASTAGNRQHPCELAEKFGCKYLMIEKPLGQSYKEVEELVFYLDTLSLTTVVNLNMRMYEPVVKLKQDLLQYPQLHGEKVITLNTGTLGIGCNGNHYLDFIFFILDADRAGIVAADVNNELIPSGRGANFCDFGGWAMINYYSREHLLAKVFFSMSSKSTVFGGWDIVAPYGRIIIDEIAQKRFTVLRKEDSQMPLNRYAADYLPYHEEPFIAPFLGDLTARWINELLKGNHILPKVRESLKVHQLMFNWLSYSKTHNEKFPIT